MRVWQTQHNDRDDDEQFDEGEATRLCDAREFVHVWPGPRDEVPSGPEE
jgi:hypothetical protein